MRMQTIKVLIVILVFTQSACSQSIDDSLLNGVWHLVPFDKVDSSVLVAKAYGWGDGITIMNGATEIDLVNKELYIPGLFRLKIMGVRQVKDNTYEIKCYFNEGEFDVYYIVHFIDKNRIWIDYRGEGKLYNIIGPNAVHYRIGKQL